jgi:hypothetical protein
VVRASHAPRLRPGRRRRGIDAATSPAAKTGNEQRRILLPEQPHRSHQQGPEDRRQGRCDRDHCNAAVAEPIYGIEAQERPLATEDDRMTSGQRRVGASFAVVLASICLASPAQAVPNQVFLATLNFAGGVKATQAWFTSGTGSVRATQGCESSSGQTNWVQYGNWVGRNVTSQTPKCSYFRWSGYEVS